MSYQDIPQTGSGGGGAGSGDVNGPASSTNLAIARWSGTTGDLLSDSLVYITDAGDLGIGNASPSYKLDVTGTGRITGAVLLDGDVTVGNASGDAVTFNAATWTIANATAVSLGGTLSIDTTTLVVDPTANKVGIGTATPATALDVVGVGTFSGGVNIGAGMTYSIDSVDIFPASVTDNMLVRFDGAGGHKLQSGAAILDDAGSLILDGHIVVNELGADLDTRIEGDADPNLIYVDASTDRVGIGVSTPTVKLDVAGALTASGDITGGSNASISGTTTTNILSVTTDATIGDDLTVTGDITTATVATGTLTVTTSATVAGNGVVASSSGSATDNCLVRMDGTGGATIQNSSAVLSDAGELSLPGALTINSANPLGMVNATTTGTKLAYLESTAPGTTGAVFSLAHRSPSPAANDLVTTLEFLADNDVGTLTPFSTQTVSATAIGSGAESSEYSVAIMQAGVQVTPMKLNQNNVIFNPNRDDLGFIVRSVTETNSIFVDGNGGNVGIWNSSPSNTLDITGTLRASQAATFNSNVTIGDDIGKNVTVNSGTWTFANDTNFVLSGGVGGLTFDTTTLTIDSANDRVGIGTASPTATLHVASGAISGGVQTVRIVPGNHTDVTATQNSINIAGNTLTITGGYTLQQFTAIGQPTITAASALSVGIAQTVSINGAPIPTGSATIVNSSAFNASGGTLVASAPTTITNAAAISFAPAIASTNVTVTNNFGQLMRYGSAVTQSAATTGLLLDFDTNFTTSASALTGIEVRIDSTNTTAKDLMVLKKDTTGVFAVDLNGNLAMGSSTNITIGGTAIFPNSVTSRQVPVFDGTTGRALTNSTMEVDVSGNVTINGDLDITGDVVFNGSDLVVIGPGLSVDNRVPRWDGVTGALIQDSTVVVDDSGNMTINGDLTITGTLTGGGAGGGDVTGPASATANGISRYNGTTGKIIKNSTATIDDSGNMTVNGNLTITGTLSGGGSGVGDVIGPASATDNALPRFDGTTGDLLQNSGVIVDDSNNVTGVNNLTIGGGTVTLSVDTDFVTSGGVNGMSIDGTTFSVDGTNNRIGIGTAAPAETLDVTGTMKVSSTATFNGTTVVFDNTLQIKDNVDTTKIVQFAVPAGHTTSTTVTHTFPAVDGTLANIGSAQTFSNKTLDNTNTVTLKDANLTIQDESDTTKAVKFECSGISTGNTRTLTIPNVSTTIAGTDATQTLTNKTLTNPTIDGGTVTLSVDTDFVTSGGVNGFSVNGNTFSVDGTNHRVGIGTATPAVTLDVVGDFSVSGTATIPVCNVTDSAFTISDNTVSTKQARFECQNISSGTIRTWSFPDTNDTFVGVTSTQEISNKTYSNPIFSGGTIFLSGAQDVSMPSQVNALSFDSGVLSIDSLNNRVGIFNVAPASTLDVVGSFAATGSATVGGSLTVDTTTLIVDSSANTVSIGSASPPSLTKLYVESSAASVQKMIFKNPNINSLAYTQLGVENSSTGGIYLSAGNGASKASMGITATGLVSGTAGRLDFGINTVDTGAIYRFFTTVGGTQREQFKIDHASGYVFNEDGAALNLRVESDTDANNLYSDGTNNRIGIGTASPSTKLHVTGQSTMQLDGSGSQAAINLTNATTKVAGQYTNITGIVGGTTMGQIALGYRAGTASTNAGIEFFSGENVTTPKAILDGSGNFGIGTPTPVTKLHVLGGDVGDKVRVEDNTATGFATVSLYNNSAQQAFTLAHSNPSAGTLPSSTWLGTRIAEPLHFVTNGVTPRMSITSAGIVGIGTQSPDNTLHVHKATAGAVTANANSPLVVENSTSCYMSILCPAASESGILFGNPGSSADGGIIYNNASFLDGLTFRTNNNVNRMVLDSTGKLQVGASLTSSVASAAEIVGADNAVALVVKTNAAQASCNASDTLIQFRSTTGVEGSIAFTATAGLIAYSTFTGSHWSQGISEKLEPGTVLVSTDELCAWEGDATKHLPKCAVSKKAEDKAVYGVYGGHDAEGDVMVLGIGSGPILVCDEGGAVEVGDFLCTSSKPGYAKRYDGHDMRVVVAKARQSLRGGVGPIAATYLAG